MNSADAGTAGDSAPITTESETTPHRRFGTFLVATGVFGIVVSVVAVIGAISFVAVVDDDLDASTEVTVDAIAAAQDSVDVLRSVVETLDGQSGELATALRDSAVALDESRDVIDGTATLTSEDIPELLDSLDAFLPAFEDAAGSVDDALDLLSEVPFGPDYDPETTLEEAVADLRPAIADLSSTLGTTGAELGEANEALAATPDQLRDTAEAIEQLDTDLGETQALVDDYERTLDDAEQVAVDALDSVEGTADWAVPIVIALALAFALSQAAPIWLGVQLRRRPAGTPLTGASPT